MLTVENLTFGFPGRTVLDRTSFSLAAGTITCLVGGNGSGKTTLLNLITGFVHPHDGSIRLAGRELVGRPPFRISRLGIARTFQDLRLIGRLSVRENLLLSISNHPGERLRWALLPEIIHRTRNVAARELVDALLSEFFLDELANKSAVDISYGQQKLVTLACCAATQADVLLLDEPIAGISSAYQEHVAMALLRLRDKGRAILLIEHQLDFLRRIGDRFLFLQDGRLQHFSTFAGLAPNYDLVK